MYQINDDMSIYVTRGDIVMLSVTAENGESEPYIFQAGDLVRIKVFKKKNCAEVVLEKDFPITAATDTAEIYLTKEDTKIGEVISKPVDYWYEVELNPLSNPQTIIGYDEDGAKVFKLFPEGADTELEEYEPTEDDYLAKFMDDELDLTSRRPVENQVIARAFYRLEGTTKGTPKYVTPQMCGAIGDGVADDTKAILTAIAALDEGNSILYFPTGTYLVTEDIPLVSNITVEGEGNNSIIKRAGNNLTNYNVLVCNALENVTIKNIHIQGDRSEHSGTEGEWGMCIGLHDCKHITIEHCKLTDAWGDGVYVGTSMSAPAGGCADITIDNCVIDHCSRNGVGVIECDGFRLRNSLITNTDRTAPQAGIDFESNNADQAITNCLVENCVFYGNLIDVSFYDKSAVQADIRTCSMRSRYGLVYDSVDIAEKVTTGGVTVIGCNFDNEDNCYLSSRKHINSVPIRFVGCVLSCNNVAIQFGGSDVTFEYEMGDVHFVDCYIAKSLDASGWIRYQNNATNYPLKNITIDVRLGGGVPYHNFRSNVAKCQLNADIKCEPKEYATEAISLDRYNAEPLICLDTQNNSCTVTLKHSIPYGMPITIRKLYEHNTVTIKNESHKFGQFDYKNSFTFTGRFDEVTIIQEKEGIWRVIDNTANGVTVV